MTEPYQNHQWKVTEEGLESIGLLAENFIEADRLGRLTDRLGGKNYEWPLHMAEKSWVDIEAFIDAFDVALIVHASEIGGVIDQNLLSESFEEARKIARQRIKPKNPAARK